MTTYFDEKETLVREASERTTTDDMFLVRLRILEDEIARDVSLCVGDREFPDDLRKKALGILACKTVRMIGRDVEPIARVLEEALVTRSSPMVVALHSFFHVVASRRVKTRFGLLSDSPRGNVERRDAHDAEKYRSDNDRARGGRDSW